ncbi:prephenate dehydratase [Candidatus Acidianus copahuensis]|uniref:Prephenate dehydratase n=1 Tax=Candidatus Acidianus copahuensis TaxID=1160895 RepID=A0A031LLQ0_9CREN|nr:prephenate dehydratase domain-containing protein [Candidatus Acidianus copahuensis]EZQ03066.1 prephenate dehydratase [Candidatus Acidianus copahuensis]
MFIYQKIKSLVVDPDGIYYLGPKGSFSHEVALKIQGENYVEQDSISSVFAAVNKNNGIGVVPIENNREGPVNDTLDNLFHEDEIYINKEIEMPIRLVLAGSSYTKITSETKVYSHNHAIQEAKRTLQKLGITRVIPVDSTSRAAILAKEENALAICSEFAAKIYGLKVIKSDIQDGINITKFAVISNNITLEGDRSVVLFTVPHKPGGLFRVLQSFYERNINLTMIYSRPLKEIPWRYYFYLEYEGRYMDELMQSMKSNVEEIKFKGSFSFLYDNARF